VKLFNSKFNSLQPDLPLLKLSFHYFLFGQFIGHFSCFFSVFIHPFTLKIGNKKTHDDSWVRLPTNILYLAASLIGFENKLGKSIY